MEVVEAAEIAVVIETVVAFVINMIGVVVAYAVSSLMKLANIKLLVTNYNRIE